MERRLSQSTSSVPTEHPKQLLTSTASAVVKHYDEKVNRPQSSVNSTVHLREFNNWVKANLINEVTRRNNDDESPIFALDFCGGAGGDVKKWRYAKIDYLVLLDQSTNMVNQALSRYINLRKQYQRVYPATFIIADASQELDWGKLLPVNISFDVVSTQFAMQYTFDTEKRARNFISNMANNLNVNGYVIATLPDASEIIKRWRSSKTSQFGNSLYQIKFADTYINTIKDGIGYGVEYTFWLADSIENCPEYLVDFSILEELANEYGLEVEVCDNFELLYQSLFKAKNFKERSLGMTVNELSPAELDVISLYLAIKFRRVDVSPKTSPRSPDVIDKLSKLSLNVPQIINLLDTCPRTCGPSTCSNYRN